MTRIHSASSISLADRCRRAWWHCYPGKLKAPELTWRQVKRALARCKCFGRCNCLPPGAKSRALGKEMHRIAEIYLHTGAEGIDWNDLPGQCLAELLPHLPPAGSVPKRNVERHVTVKVNGVKFRGLIDVVGAALGAVVENYDHKTTRDIRTYALLPHSVAVRVKQPKRSLKDDLQSCMYVLARAKETTPVAPGGLNRWNYTETQRSRRSLPVLQYVPTAHARTVVARAAVVAKEVEAYRTIDDAPPNTLACDDYGGCWYRSEGHCKVPRKWGYVFKHHEQKQKELDAMGKPLTFKNLTSLTTAANAKSQAEADRAAKKRKPAPPPVEDADDEDTDEDEDEAPPPPPPPPAKRKAKAKPAPVDTGDNEDEDEDPAAVTPPAKASLREALEVPDSILQHFTSAGMKGESKVLATMYAEFAEHQAANLSRNPERAACLRKLLEARDAALRSLNTVEA